MITFTADGKDLAAAIAKAAPGLSSRPVNPIHAGILLQAGGLSGAPPGMIRITASDGEVAFSALVDAAIEEHDSVIIPGRMLSEFSRYFGKVVSFESDGNNAIITSGKSRFMLNVQPGAKFPQWLGFPDVLGKLDSEDFADAVKAVNVSAARNDMVLRGIRLEIKDDKLLMVSTDRSRMTLASPQLTAVTLRADVAPPPPVLVSASILERFSHVLEKEVSFGWSGNLTGVATEGLIVTAPQISGDFVKGWEMITRDYPPYVSVDPVQLLDEVRAAALAAGDRGTVGLTFGKKALMVKASSDSGYHGELEWLATTEETDAGIGKLIAESRVLEFTPKYLIDGITACRDQLSLSYTGRALLLCGEDVRYLVQPRRAISTGE